MIKSTPIVKPAWRYILEEFSLSSISDFFCISSNYEKAKITIISVILIQLMVDLGTKMIFEKKYLINYKIYCFWTPYYQCYLVKKINSDVWLRISLCRKYLVYEDSRSKMKFYLLMPWILVKVLNNKRFAIVRGTSGNILKEHFYKNTTFLLSEPKRPSAIPKLANQKEF